MRPFPFLMIAAICGQVSRFPIPISDGKSGGEPVRFSPWQTPHWLK